MKNLGRLHLYKRKSPFRFLVKAMGIIVLISLFSCKTEREVTIKNTPSSNKSEKLTDLAKDVQENGQGERIEVVDILTPEPFSENSEAAKELKEKDIFDLWDIFFRAFVIPISQDPYKSRVNYESLYQLGQSKDQELTSLLGLIERKMAVTNLSHLTPQKRASFYINAYNYTAIRLVHKGYIDSTGKKITSFLDLSKGPNPLEIIYREVLPLHHGIVSLEDLENKMIKGHFEFQRNSQESSRGLLDARFHLILSNTSISRPSLLNEAFRAEKLEEQIDFIVKAAFQDRERIATIKEDTLYLSRLFKWYKEDFEADKNSIAEFVSHYAPELGSFKRVKYLNYSYDINILKKEDGQGLSQTPDLPTLSEFEQSDSAQSDSNKQNPCSYLKSQKRDPLLYCDHIVSGELDGFYQYRNRVDAAKICIYRIEESSSSEQGAQLGIRGRVEEFNHKLQSMKQTDLIIEDEYKYDEGIFTLRTSGGVRTKAIVNINDNTAEIRQTSIIFGKGYRKFSLECSPVN